MTPSPSKGQDLSRNGLPQRLKDATPFDLWWYNVGSGIAPLPSEELEAFAKRVALHAWVSAREKPLL